MAKRSLVALALVTLLMVVAAVATLMTSGGGPGRAGSDERALPALGPRLGEAATVEIRRTGLDLTFVRDGNDWLVEQKSGYPADAAKVRRVVLALADMTLVEPKTAEPALYPRLGVEDPGHGKSTLVVVKDKSGTDIARLIVGRRSYDRLGAGNDGVYLRMPGDSRSWLARGSLDFSDDVPGWLARQIVDVPSSRIAKVAVTQPDGATLTLSRAKPDAKFAVENPPKDAKFKSDAQLAEPATGLETLSLDDVRLATKFAVPNKGVTVASYTTFDGLTVRLRLFQAGGKDWAALSASGAGTAATEAKRIQDKVGRWVYAIPSYKAKLIETKLADLIEPAKGS
jgi:Domain of unknown function (DUF4340)